MDCQFHYYVEKEPLLHHVVEKSKIQCIKSLLHRNVDVNESCSENITAIAIAIDNQDVEVVKLLLPHADLEKTFNIWNEDMSEWGVTNPMDFAKYVGNSEIYRAVMEKAEKCKIARSDAEELEKDTDYRLMQYCAPDEDLTVMHSMVLNDFESMRVLIEEDKTDVDVMCDCGRNALSSAIIRGNAEEVKLLLENGVVTDGSVVSSDTDDDLPIFVPALVLAANIGNCDILQSMTQYCSDLNNCDDIGRTALMVAATNLRYDCMQILLDGGCDAKITDNSRQNVLFYLLNQHIDGSDLEAVNWIYQLKSAGCSLDHLDDSGIYPLHLALRHDNENIFRHLLRAGAQPSLLPKYGHSPLYIAALRRNEDAVKYVEILLSYGASPEVSWQSVLPGTLLNDYCGYRMFQLIFDQEADINGIQDNIGTTLVASAILGRPEFSRIALENHAKINISNYTRIVPYHAKPMNVNNEALMLVFAAGERYPYFNDRHDDTRPDGIRSAEKDTRLANICRTSLRKYLVNANPTVNLFDLVSKTSLPMCLQKYVLFDMSFA